VFVLREIEKYLFQFGALRQKLFLMAQQSKEGQGSLIF
jgi:hypothetical protein